MGDLLYLRRRIRPHPGCLYSPGARGGQKGQYTQQLDTYTFQARVAARCTVFPDLNNAELQNSWGVAKPEELIGKLLIGGEFDDYVTEVFQHNGFKTEDELVNDAKN